MVGLKEVGEAAWAVEQTLNLWLRQELEIGVPIFDLLDSALRVFSAWVLFLEARSENQPDPEGMIALALSLIHI